MRNRALTNATNEAADRMKHGERRGWAVMQAARNHGVEQREVASELGRRGAAVRARRARAKEVCADAYWNR